MMLNRRQFLKISLSVGAVAALDFSLVASALAQQAEFKPNPFLTLGADGRITYYTPRSDMGQGSATGLRLIVAEELAVDPDSLFVTSKSPESGFWAGTGGSSGTFSVYRRHRAAFATVRQVLLKAAAKHFNAKMEDCVINNGVISYQGKQLSYGALVPLAKELELPSQEGISLIEPKDFKWIGKERKLDHIDDIVQGKARYGIDVELPGMVHASIERCPYPRGSLKSFDAEAALTMPGVIDVVAIEGSGWDGQSQYRPAGIAVVAETAWQAQQARHQLTVQWHTGGGPLVSDTTIDELFEKKLKKEGVLIYERGDVADAIDGADKVLEATYKVPFWAHAPLEPMNATAVCSDTGCEVWSGCHLQTILQAELAALSGWDKENIKVHTPLIGGSFGRRLMRDYAIEAVILSKQLKRPVQVLFTRTDEMQQGVYMPGGQFKLQSAVKGAKVKSLSLTVVQQSIETQREPGALKDGKDEMLATEPLRYPYEFENLQYRQHYAHELPIPTGYWRGTYSNSYAFAFESWIDELAHHTGTDPLAFRLSLLADDKTPAKLVERDIDAFDKKLAKSVMTYAAEMAGWGGKQSAGRGLGIAWCYTFFYAYGAAVVDVTLNKDGSTNINKVYFAVDCGVAVNPNMVKAQIESGIIWALSAMQTKIHFNEGKVINSSFADYPVLTYEQCPEIEVKILPSTRPSAGVGELANVPVFAALQNAIFAAGGPRIRAL